MEPSIISEDRHFLFINKPSSFDSSFVAGGRPETVSSWLLQNQPHIKDFGYKPDDCGLLNRLDFETSGVLIAAKNNGARDSFLELTKKNAVEKKYIFLAETLVEKKIYVSTFLGSRGRKSKTIRVFDAPKKKDRALLSDTDFTPLSLCTEKNISFVYASIRQGRRHQIRVHASHAGFPLLGDATYGAKNSLDQLSQKNVCGVPFLLHSYEIRFIHPFTGEVVSVQAPIPKEILSLRKDYVWRDLLKNVFTQ